METGAYMKEFQVNFAKLKNNRQNIPLGQLTTRYAKAYNGLVKWIEEYAEWFTEMYITTLALPEHPNDHAGNEWLHRKIERIKEDERKPGGLYQQIRDALIVDLDEETFELKVYRLFERLVKEAWDPYQQRFNKWVGKPDNRWIYNSLFDAFWKVDPEVTEGGYWIDKDWNHKGFGYPPRIRGEDNHDES